MARGGVEIERRFLLEGLPPTMRYADREPIRQGCLAVDGYAEVREVTDDPRCSDGNLAAGGLPGDGCDP